MLKLAEPIGCQMLKFVITLGYDSCVNRLYARRAFLASVSLCICLGLVSCSLFGGRYFLPWYSYKLTGPIDALPRAAYRYKEEGRVHLDSVADQDIEKLQVLTAQGGIPIYLLRIENSPSLTDVGIGHLGQETFASGIELENLSSVTGRGFQSWQGMTKLWSINIVELSALDDSTLITIFQLPRLSDFLIIGSNFTDVGMMLLAQNAKKLEWLRVADSSGVTDRSLSELRHAPALISVDLINCSGITTEGVLQLVKMPQLRFLTVRGCANVDIEVIKQDVYQRNRRIRNMPRSYDFRPPPEFEFEGENVNQPVDENKQAPQTAHDK